MQVQAGKTQTERNEHVDRLIERFGDLITYEQLAEYLHRDTEGLRITLSRSNQVWAQKVNKAKLKIGRRVLFSAVGVAAVVDELMGK
jgi:predicted nucleotidyltransferase